jgi:putative transposase
MTPAWIAPTIIGQIPRLSRLKGFRYPRDVIAFAVWAYHRFALSTADVEDLLAERGVIVTRETVRLWVNRFGRHFADCIRRDRPRPNDKWHMDEVVITDKLRGYIKPIKTLAPDTDHRAHKGLNNAIEVSHRPTRIREKIFGRFKTHRQAQRFLSAHDQINLIFRPRRYKLTATSYRHARNDAFNLWADYTAEMTA